MKCASIVAEREFVPGQYTMPGMFLVFDPYPQPVPGIRVMRDECAVDVGGKHVAVSRSLLLLPDSSGAIRRDHKAGTVTILRASVWVNPEGDFELIPEREDDTDGTLLLLDVSRGFCLGVRYEATPAAVITRSGSRYGSFMDFEEVLLASLKPAEAIQAVRYVTTGWFRWRKDHVVERITYRVGADNVVFETKLTETPR